MIKFCEISDGWVTFYVNAETGEKKFKLDEGDICVERQIDDFCRTED